MEEVREEVRSLDGVSERETDREETVLAVDVGYGDTKACTDTSKIKFPSAIARVDGGDYRYEGDEYVVGERAFVYPQVISTLTPNFVTRYSPILVYHAALELGVSDWGATRVVVSLAVDEYRPRREELTKKLTKFIINDVVIEPAEVVVLPQGLGIWCDAGMPSSALIVDVGFNTVDVMLIQDGRPVPNASFSLHGLGVCTLVAAIQRELKRETGLEISEVEAKEFLVKRKAYVMRREYDLSDLVRRESIRYAELIWSRIVSRDVVRSALPRVEVAVLAGGGARFVPHSLVEEYGLFVPPEPEFANVRGFHKYAVRRAHRDSEGRGT